MEEARLKKKMNKNKNKRKLANTEHYSLCLECVTMCEVEILTSLRGSLRPPPEEPATQTGSPAHGQRTAERTRTADSGQRTEQEEWDTGKGRHKGQEKSRN